MDPLEGKRHPVVSYPILIGAWGALMLLIPATVAVSRSRLLGGWSPAGSLVIASIKAGIILLFFMHFRHEPGVIRVAVAASLLALGFILGLTFTDVFFRG